MSSESFGARFQRGVVERITASPASPASQETIFKEQFLHKLDPERAYVFLLRSEASNRIVCKAPEKPCVHFLFSNAMAPKSENTISLDDATLRELFPVKQVSVDEVKQFWKNEATDIVTRNFICGSIVCPETQGYLIIALDGCRIAKLYTPMYAICMEARGTGSLRTRYIEILSSFSSPGISQRWVLSQLYPENAMLFASIDFQFNSVVQIILQLYFDIKVRKKVRSIPGPLYPVISSCHRWHCQNRVTNLVNAFVVATHIRYQPPQSISRILRSSRFRLPTA
jgi:hypothetical protein